MTRRVSALTPSSSISTAMWPLARNTAAPPMKENSTIRQIEAGSGHDSALFIT